MDEKTKKMTGFVSHHSHSRSFRLPSNYAGLLYGEVRAEQARAWYLHHLFPWQSAWISTSESLQNGRLANNNILLGISCLEIEAIRAGISFRRALNICKRGTRYSLSSSSADTEHDLNAPFCFLFFLLFFFFSSWVHWIEFQYKFENQSGQGDYPGSFHSPLCFWGKECDIHYRRRLVWSQMICVLSLALT